MYSITGSGKTNSTIKEKQKIAILIDWYLPGTRAGGPVRSIYSLVELIRHEFDLYIITTNTDLGSTQAYPGITPNQLTEKEGVKYFYFSKDHLTESNMLALIRKISPDLVYLNSFWSYSFSVSIVKAQKNKKITCPVLLAPRGMLGKGALSLKVFKKKLFLLVAKITGWYEHIRFHATNQQEKEDILKQFPTAKIMIAPNVNSGAPRLIKKEKKENHLRLFYLSRVARVKNLHFALEALQFVPAEIQVDYDIFGNLEDKEYWNECREIISRLPDHVKVKHCGEISFNEVQEKISSYHALFLPTLNENFGHSIVESLLSACLVVISDQTPWNDVEARGAGYALPLSDKKTFAGKLTEIAILKQNEFDIRSKKAIDYISDKLNIEKALEQYKQLINESIKN